MLHILDIIRKKRDGGTLTKDEIEYFVRGCTDGSIPDYQLSALLMAIYLNGMTHEETAELTLAMAHSGDMADLSAIHGVTVDKHSTGGVGDKTSMVIVPVCAACGVKIAKMSGRGLGHTGGTADKLESIPGMRIDLSPEEFTAQINKIGCAMIGQTGELCPADKKLYALRDVTGTVESVPLIASSIMSKKIASGAERILLDVKTGSGAFMKNEADAKALAQIMVDIGKSAGRTCYGVITDMNEPLGCKVGNALEVIEAVQVLAMKDVKAYLEPDLLLAEDNNTSTREGYDRHGIHRLLTVSLTLAAYMYMAAGKSDDFEAAKAQCEKAIESGAALAKFREFVEAQGGDGSYIDDVIKFRLAANCVPIVCEEDGYLAACNTSEVGMVNLILGGGRATKDSTINLGVGLDIRKHLGDVVRKGDVLAYMYIDDMGVLEEAKKRLLGAYTISKEIIQPEAIVKNVVV